MIFGKHINRYYFKYAVWLLFGLSALVLVDFLQLEIPKIYRLVINGMNSGSVSVDGVQTAFDMDFLLDGICMPMLKIVLAMVFGRFLWRICFFGAAVRLEADLRNRMFDHAKDLSREYYQVNKVGNLMSLFTNDLDTVQECFGWGVLMFFDALMLGVLAVMNMWKIDSIVPDSHGLSAGGGHNNREADDEEVGHPPGGLLQALGFLPGKLFRHRGDQGLRQGGQGADGFPEAERGEREGQY